MKGLRNEKVDLSKVNITERLLKPIDYKHLSPEYIALRKKMENAFKKLSKESSR